MLSSAVSWDHVQMLVQERLVEAEHAALARQASAVGAGRRRSPSALRLRLASSLRGLACRLDPSPALNA